MAIEKKRGNLYFIYLKSAKVFLATHNVCFVSIFRSFVFSELRFVPLGRGQVVDPPEFSEIDHY